MDSNKGGFTSIDEYIATFSVPIQVILQEIRAAIRAAAPDAVEGIGYQMPTFNQKGNLVYFAPAKKFIGLYPASGSVRDAFKDELAAYEGTPGSIHLPLDQPMPLKLIADIVQYRIAENQKNAEAKERAREEKANARKKK